MGLYTNPEYDGLGLPRLDSAMVFEELAWGDTAVAAYMSIHNMAAWMIGEYGSDTLCKKNIYPIWSAVSGLAAIA
nr:acyl-CoA dehydrogenase family protein [Psychrobacter sp. JCM 18901]